MRNVLPLLILLVGLATNQQAAAQSNRLIPAEDQLYEFIVRLQRRGMMLELNPTALPYTEVEVRRALAGVDTSALSARERGWLDHIASTLRPAPDASGDAIAGGRIDGKLISANTDRHDPLRPIGDGDVVLTDGAASLFFELDRWIAHAGIRHSLYYDRDPDGLDSVRRLYIRNEDSYAGFNGDRFSLYAGRFSNQWGSAHGPALVLSNNPRPYDQLHLRFGGGRLALRGVFGELDAISATDEFTGDAFEDGAKRRFISAHRLDWRPSRRLTITLTESLLISGVNAGPSIPYILPATFYLFATANRPRNDENNGMMGAMIWWNTGRLTLESELAVDDFDFLKLGDISEPAAIAFRQSLHRAGSAWQPDLGLAFEAVASLTYAAQQREGKYLYLKRGLATPFSDYVHARAYADFFLDEQIPGFRLSPQIHVLAQGERTILDNFALTDPAGRRLESILTGVVETTVRPALDVFFQPSPWFWIRADLGVNFTTNAGHVDGASSTAFAGMLQVGGRVALNRRFLMGW